MSASRAKRSTPPSPTSPESSHSRYANREQSWLAFNRRVLDQARHSSNPILERVKFLAIVSSNLDEFFEIRVAGLMQQADSAAVVAGLDGTTPREQLRTVGREVAEMVREQYRCWQHDLIPRLADEGIVIQSAAELDAAGREYVQQHFEQQVLPVLTPLAVDQAHPFPQLAHKSLNVLVSVAGSTEGTSESVMVLVPVPRSLPRIVPLPPSADGRRGYIFLSEIIKLCAAALLPGFTVRGAHAFRVTRNSDLYIDEEEAENLLKRIEQELRNLRRGAAVRLEIDDGVDPELFNTLCRHLDLDPVYAYRIQGALNLTRLMSLYEMIDRPDLKYPPFTPADCPALVRQPDLFAALREGDILLHHPYDSFAPVVQFVDEAARDPEVLAIKQTLYRTSGDSPIVRALIQASMAGKQVTALVELMARFDEANNIKWARELEESGVHVVYGVVGQKTHCKCCLVVRREGADLRRYVHLGTGNYNPRTARLYTDVSLLTCRPHLTAEVAQLFNVLTGLGRTPQFDHLLVAPFNLHSRTQELIAAETAYAVAGRPARIIAKMNKLVDPETIDNLYAASAAGVQIDLIVRATCCLRAGVPGLSENIRLRSIVGRFLEHARIFHFANGGRPLVYCGSADWMPRNFFRRIETLFPVEEPILRDRLLQEVLHNELQDNEDARVQRPDCSYAAVPVPPSTAPFSAQRYFMAAASLRNATLPVPRAPTR